MSYPAVGSPPRIAGGLSCWFRVAPLASYPVYQSFGGSLVSADGQKIGYVPPFAPGLAAWRNDDNDERPTYKANIRNGKGVARFDGVDDYIDSAAYAVAPRTWENWIVCKFSGAVVTEQRPWSNPEVSVGISRMEVDPLAALTSFSTCQQVANHNVNSSGAWHLWRFVSDVGFGIVERDGVNIWTQGAAPYMPLLSPSLSRLGGSYSAGLLLDGDIAEFVQIPYRLSAAQATRMLAWFVGEWGPF